MASTDNHKNTGATPAPSESAHGEAIEPSRRSVVRGGVKLVFVPPVISTFFASEAYAGNYSCYGVGHECLGGGQYEDGNAEECCPGLNCTGPEPKTCK